MAPMRTPRARTPIHGRITSLPRAIDLRYPPNLAVVLIAAATFVLGVPLLVLLGRHWSAAGLAALDAALGVLLAWALARELDPDLERAALVAAGFALSATWAANDPSLIALIWLLLLLRLANRSSGLPSTWLDVAGLVAVAAWLGHSLYAGFGFVAAAVLVTDGMLEPRRRGRLAAAIVPLAVDVGLAWRVGAPVFERTPTAITAVLLIAAVFLPLVLRPEYPKSRGDHDGERLNGARVRAARGAALTLAVWVAWTLGDRGATLLAPLWTALLAIVFYRAAAWIGPTGSPVDG